MKALAFTGPATMDVSLASTNQSSTTVPATETQQQQQNLYSHIVPSFRRCRALVLDSSYRPIDVINWQRAICLDLFDKASLSSCIFKRLCILDTCSTTSGAHTNVNWFI
jgi:hypothetical protein